MTEPHESNEERLIRLLIQTETLLMSILSRLETAVVALENIPAPVPVDPTAATSAEQDAIAQRLEAVAVKFTPPA